MAKKRGRKKMAEHEKKQARTYRYTPEIIEFFEHIGKGKVSRVVCGIVERSKAFRDWKRSKE